MNWYFKNNSNEVDNLKGTIDITLISNLNNNTDDTSREFCFSITVNNEREFFFSAGDADEKESWTNQITERRNHLNKKYGVEELGLKETVIFVGILSSRYRYKFRNSCVCLTNKNLRWYRSSRILDEESTWDFVPGLIGTVPLLGSSIQYYTDDAGQTYLVIFDTRGNKYYIRSVNDTDLKNWYDEISKVIRKLVQDFILEGHTLSINFEAQSQEEDVPEGSGILNINKKKKWSLDFYILRML